MENENVIIIHNGTLFSPKKREFCTSMQNLKKKKKVKLIQIKIRKVPSRGGREWEKQGEVGKQVQTSAVR